MIKDLFCAATALLLLSSCDSSVNSSMPLSDGTVIYTAAQVITMDNRAEAETRPGAVAVKDGVIVAVGSREELQRQMPTATLNQQFAKQTIMPGFIEPHLHPYLVGLLLQMEFITPHDWTLLDGLHPGVKTAQEYQKRLRDHEKTLAGGEILFSWGYHPLFHGEMSRQFLDTVSSQRPIVIFHRSFHEVYLNSAAIGLLKIDTALDSHPTIDFAMGHFYETGLLAISAELMGPLMQPEPYLAALAKGRELIHRRGITTVGDGAFGSINLPLEHQLLTHSSWNHEDAPFHTYLLLDGTHLLAKHGYSDIDQVLESAQETLSGDHFTVQKRQIKLFADGAAYSQLMQMRDGYIDGHSGEWIMSPAELKLAMQHFWQRDYQLHLHVNGDAGMQQVLDILTVLQRQKPRSDHRTTIHHLAYVRPEQMQQLANLGGMVQANPYYVWALADTYAEHGLGAERAANMVPSASMVDAGMPLAFHSDFTMAPADPLLLAWAAVTRFTAEGNVVAPAQRISVHEALEAITLDAAVQLRREDQIGSITVGKKANFTILDSDPYLSVSTGNGTQLKDIKIIATVVDGKVFQLLPQTDEVDPGGSMVKVAPSD
ncbi:amidohydrolase [Porticoccaceae bacterium]|nr:amidohydrolase [Porticoccaceae bacterium]